MKVKMTWLLAFKIFIVLFWSLGMVGFIDAAIDNQKTFLELLARWDIVFVFVTILLGCISIILDCIFKNKNIMVSYFFIFFLSVILITSFGLFKEYLSFVEYGYRWTHWYEFTTNGET
ncbi:hypothetical protein OQH60_08540, partial [Campylobacter sp. MIT 21-1685]|uniref:hypothetical protein n=1 Tax=unclassified Campylobacter TaxID=2593542 RepID=UPI00224B9BD2